MNCMCDSLELMMLTALTEFRAQVLVSMQDRAPSHRDSTHRGTASAAAFLHCLETQAQTAISLTSRKLRTVVRSSRGRAPAEGTWAVRAAPGRKDCGVVPPWRLALLATHKPQLYDMSS